MPDATLLYRIAQYYYVYNYSQEEISKRENISRSQISRLLKKARNMGIVKIDISLPHTMNKEKLKEILKNILGLQNVVITPAKANDSENDAILYTRAADYLGSVMGQYRNVGIGWGKTLYQTSLQIPYQGEHDDLTFYPVVGNSGTDNPFLQASNICDRFAERFHAKVNFSNSLVVTKANSMNSISLIRLEHLRNAWSNLDLLVIGLGGTLHTKTLYIEEIPHDAFSEQVFERVTGDILGTFILEDQSILEIPEGYQSIAMDLDTIRKTKNVIGIAHGTPKVDIIIYAALKGYIKTLITDSNTAVEILEKLGQI